MMNAVVKPYHEMCLNSSELIVPRDGHYYAQASMVTEQYAHILDDDRRLNAQRFDDFFYQH